MIVIYYYTPLPLNLPNKQQQARNNSSKQQALLLPVLAIAQASSLPALLYSGHPEVHVVPLPVPGFEPKNSPVAAQGVDAKLGGPLRNLRSFKPKTAIFRLK